MPSSNERKVIALGFFDGVHLGHQALLRRAVERAGGLGAVPAACTFDAHPAALIAHRQVPLLTTPADRAAYMAEHCGIREVLIAPVDEAMMTMPWDRFVTGFLAERNNACHLICGEDHRFGYKGEGTADKLKTLCARLGLGCDVIPKVEMEGETVSSTRVRAFVQAGEIERAGRFLGHPYFVTAPVIHGKGLGHTLGFPTVNLAWPGEVLLPARGVYAARARLLPTGEDYIAVTNIGVRPTVDDSGAVSVESFLLDFSGDLYGRSVRLELHRRLRDERKFDSLEALRGQVRADAQAARRCFQR